MNKSVITNILSIVALIVGYLFNYSMLYSIGIFAFSGAITNWLAVHMLFEKIPGIYGSGVIPNRFEEFKLAIKNLILSEFFTSQNIEKFLSKDLSTAKLLNSNSIIKNINLEDCFESLTEVILNSSFGSILSMFGGVEALEPLKQPFIEKINENIVKIINGDEIQKIFNNSDANYLATKIQSQIEIIINNRLNELTPKMVKEIVQKMIKQHLGWLVVWGGVFGAIIGAISFFISI